MSYVKDRTVAFIIDESVVFDGEAVDNDGDVMSDEEQKQKLTRTALRILNKRVGVRERIILAVDKPERVYRIWADAGAEKHLRCVKK